MADDDYEAVLLVIKECNVYRIPPRATSRGYKASDWDVTQHLWSGRLRITASSKRATIRLEDPNTGDLFAASPYDPNGTTVEPVADSSRYFVMRIVDPGSGQHAFVGIGFPERGWAFDFNVALQDFATRLERANSTSSEISSSSSSAKKIPEGPKVDYSLKEGQTISINLGNSASAKKPTRPPPTASDMSLPFLPPPPSAASAKREQPQTASPSVFQAPPQQPATGLGGDWTDFGGFVGGTTADSQQAKPPTSTSSSVPSTWTTF